MTDFIARIPEWLWILLVVHGVVLGTVAYMILLERKTAAWVQDRLGPNRVGPKGLLQPMADGLKFFFKEDYRPANVDRYLFTLAPAIMMIVIIISIAIIPWGGVHERTRVFDVTHIAAEQREEHALSYVPAVARRDSVAVEMRTIEIAPGVERVEAALTYQYAFMIADLNIGVLFGFAMLSLAVYGVVLGGWSSNNKYSFIGGMRACANMISYEIPMGISIVTVLVLYGTLHLGDVVSAQSHYWGGFIPAWNVFAHPAVFLLFLICIHAEANRAPFDVAEAEQELVGGYHTEYSSMRFALFFLAEYAGMITTSAICVALFFGGWHLPWIEWIPAISNTINPANPEVTNSLWVALLRSAVFFTKVILVLFVFMWVRWSLPRFRYDQIMIMAWRALLPLGMALLVATIVVMYFYGARIPVAIDGRMALVLIATNIAVVLLAAALSFIYPPAPETNRKFPVPDSRFQKTPLPAEPAPVGAVRAG